MDLNKDTVHKGAGWAGLIAAVPILLLLLNAGSSAGKQELRIAELEKDLAAEIADRKADEVALQADIDALDETRTAVLLFEKDMEYMKKTLDDILKAVKP